MRCDALKTPVPLHKGQVFPNADRIAVLMKPDLLEIPDMASAKASSTLKAIVSLFILLQFMNRW